MMFVLMLCGGEGDGGGDGDGDGGENIDGDELFTWAESLEETLSRQPRRDGGGVTIKSRPPRPPRHRLSELEMAVIGTGMVSLRMVVICRPPLAAVGLGVEDI